ncbi:MAG: Ig domain-containing protein, partial [Pseudomonadota bacterium]
VLTEERSDVLGRGRFRKGDSISVMVTPDDREVLGKPKKSDPVIISNSPPMIVSSPPTSVTGALYTYEVKATDPDDDPIIFSLKKGPKGMEIDSKTGLIRWEIRKEAKGAHIVEIEASENAEARSFQRYTLAVDFR